jgi:predicted TIM-barrel fold metal-dependent hydrolase
VKIDFHTHIWPEQVGRVPEFVAALDRAGIDKAVVMPIAPHGTNDEVARCVEQAPDRLIGFASVTPNMLGMRTSRADPLSELDRAVNSLGLKGLKLHPVIQGFAIDDPSIAPVVDAAGSLGIPVLVHTGIAFVARGRMRNAAIELIDDLAILCPGTTIVVGHGEPLLTGPELAKKHPNVYLETSGTWASLEGIIPGVAKRALEIAGPEKVLLGSDFNVDREERLAEAIGVFERAAIPDEWRDAVYSANALRLLGG